ncbi:hypothetical protein [Methanosphaera sp.]|uniref:hypothetical protein n=1 Tax=Methanosphaera sp. TaxID=2666342 RepID=UPI0025D34F24|nr:hypothetical protein [Methanosphaera sp.]
MYHNNRIIENNISNHLINTIYNFSKMDKETYIDRYLNKIKEENEKSNNNLIKIFRILFNNHDYDSMINMISLMNFKKNEEKKLIAVINFYKDWDLFEYDNIIKYNYQGLPEVFQPINEKHLENLRTLKKICSEYKEYRLVIDLINNAKRRNEEGKYNEAIIQLYRALELATQLKLKKFYKIETDNINLNRLEELKINKHFIEYLKKFTNSYNNIHLSLKEQLYILKGLKDPMGKFYWNNQDLFMDIIEMRHSSLLVHGNTNITVIQYQEYEYLVKEFVSKLNKNIKKCIKNTEFPKFEIEK